MFNIPIEYLALISVYGLSQLAQLVMLGVLVGSRRRKRPLRSYVLPNGLIVGGDDTPPQPQPVDPRAARAAWKAQQFNRFGR